MALINVSANIMVAGGPNLAFNRPLDVDAYDKIDVTVPGTTTDKEVDLPGGPVQFIAIMSDWYGNDLTYKINTTTATSFNLNQPLLFIGADAVLLLGSAPTKLFFSNTTTGTTAKDAKVQMLIGRDATP